MFFVGEPDTYVTLKLDSAPDNNEQRTATVSKSRAPVWNETKKFAIDENAKNILGKCRRAGFRLPASLS